MRLILSPVGTSILTNQAGQDRSQLYKYSNTKEGETPDEIRRLITRFKSEAESIIQTDNIKRHRQASAELNGVYGIYNSALPTSSTDQHWLISTDTYQGIIASAIIQTFIKTKFPNTQVYTPRGLTADDKTSFQNGIKDLLKWCDDTLPGYKDSGYEIIFNLTGGFKSLQGFLNTIGMFYADKITYIFETGNELITIPRLPIRIEYQIFEQNADIFLQLAQAPNGINSQKIINLPTIMTDCVEDRCTLSNWGTLTWNKTKHKILSSELISLPHIKYENSFERDFFNTDRDKDKIKLQEVIAKVSCTLVDNNGNTASLRGGRAGGVLYDNYAGNNKHLGHFRIDQGKRVSCEAIDGVLHLRHFGEHDYVNDNP